MASQYDSIKTAEELLKEVAAHGLSTKPEDICRAQDIFGRSEVKELIRLANDNGRLNGFDSGGFVCNGCGRLIFTDEMTLKGEDDDEVGNGN